MTTKTEPKPKTTPKPVGHETLWKALAAFQTELPHVGKDSTNSHFKNSYASLEDISAKVLPILGRHGLSFTARTNYTEHGLTLHASVTHESGDEIEAVWPVAGSNAQQLGSAMTYGRRYLLCSLTGVAPGGEDDDGNAAAQAPLPERKAPNARPTPPADPGPALAAIAAAQSREELDAIYQKANQTGGATPEVMAALTERSGYLQAVAAQEAAE